MTVFYKLLIVLGLTISVPFIAGATDHHLANAGKDTNSCLSGLPCRTMGKVLSIRAPGDRIIIDDPTYDFGTLEHITIIPASGTVTLILPSGNVPLDANFQVWVPFPSAADVKISIKPGGEITKYNISKRKVSAPNHTLQCTVDTQTNLEVLK